MRITFSGKQDKLTPSQERKLAMAFARLSKLLERRGEKGAQVILTEERHLRHAEVRVNFYDHALFGKGSAPDQFTAIMDAVEKVEKQALRLLEKKRELKRSDSPRKKAALEAAEAVEAPEPAKKGKKARAEAAEEEEVLRPARVVKASSRANGKPMTLEEAMLAMEDGRDYLLYRDADTDKLQILIRRSDGAVDLVEA
ncbi:MAG: HPF/RaiA family ribosome-associated protein [Bryobacteraceae bacterium]